MFVSKCVKVMGVMSGYGMGLPMAISYGDKDVCARGVALWVQRTQGSAFVQCLSVALVQACFSVRFSLSTMPLDRGCLLQ